ncbi:DUF2786 domain-containing protein [Falsiroseomonas selenitidurans]|uniref:DUF2786 domain-containing protein n=1 Tax=Falsiroseomonas selenitidurans TaxID=2716335 RepID=A0ABX1E8M1_9PROT|nr:DUF2786 domain-containing protein [Falsiroseomonas selenitidurans]NKC31240.1 DUF2786 domain-containing protein [Falsiroseomonas selenitidurans]
MDPGLETRQQTELEKVKARIRALAAKTTDRGCSEAEALIAAQKVGELLEVYGLTMSEVELREELCIQRETVLTGPRTQALGGIFMAIIRMTETRGWMNGRYGYVLFGLEPDVLMGVYLLHLVAGAVDHEEAVFRASEAYRRSRRTPQQRLRSFRYGFAERVAARMDELAAHRRQAAAAAQANSTGTALVLVKEQRLAEAFRGLGIRLRSRTTTRRVADGAAYRHGMEAGGRVGLERPVGQGGGTRALPRR